jgi:hypothetical protein
MKSNNLNDNNFLANLGDFLQDLSTTDEASLVGGRRGRKRRNDGTDDAPDTNEDNHANDPNHG